MSQQQDEGAPVVGDDSEFQDVPLDESTEQLPPAPVAADSDGEEDDKTSDKDLDDDNEDTDDEADEKYSSNDDEGIISDEEVGGSSNAKVLPDPQKQRAIIKDLELSQPMEVGQTWYLIAIQWWRHWREWVQWDSRYTFHRSTPPGPIDNSPLLEPGTNIVARMKMDNFDYQLANEAMWNHLVEWYGGGPAIPRKVISYGIYTSSKSVEVYPQVLNFYFRDAPTKVFQENFSKSDNLDNVKKFLCNKFELKPDEVRLWLVRDNIPHKYLKSLTDSVYSCNFYRDDKILIDKRNADGTWPKVTRPKRRDNKWGYRIEPTEVGLTGLQNLGNTCFMNSALQCLSNTFCLTRYFVTGEYKKHINRVNPLGMGGDIAEQYADLVKDLWSGKYKSVAPQDFKWKMEQYAPQFQGSQQHDSQELLGFLLDGMHEDLNKIIDKPFIEAKDHGGRDDNLVAKEYWQNYKARNDSIIVDWFQGQLKNTLHCPECKRYAITFDPFMYLSLALPTIQTVSVRITVVFLDNKKKPIRVSVKVKKSGTVKDAKVEISKMFSIPLDNLIIAEVHDHYIYHFYNDNDDTEDIETGAIYCFEVQSKHHHPVLYPETFGYLLPAPPVKTSEDDSDDDDDFEDFVRVPIVHRKYEIYSYGAHTSRQSARFGVPSFIYVPRNITANQLYHYLVTHFRGQMMRERPLPPRPPRPAPPVPSRPSPPVVEPKSSLYSRPSLASRYDSDDDSDKDNKKVYDSDGDSELSDTPFVDDDIEAGPAPVAQDSDYEDFVPKDEFDDVEGSAFNNNENDGGVDSTEKVIVIIDGEEVEIPLEKEDATSTPIVDEADEDENQKNSNDADADAEADTEKDEEGETSDANMNSLGDSFNANKSDVEIDVEADADADDLEGSQNMVDDGDALDADQDQFQDQEQDQREQELKEREQRLQEQANNPDFSFQDENNHIQFADGYNIDMKLFTIRLTEHTGYRDTDTYYDDDAPLHLRDRQTLLIEWSDDAISRFYDHNRANDFDIHPSYQTTFSNSGNDRLTLDQCLKKFTETETLEADNTWFCSKCQKDMQADKKFDLWRLPRILVIALKRFSYRGRASRDKLDNLVDFPLKDLDLRPYLSGPLEADDPPPIYDLYAVSNHMGGMYGGHYTAYAKNVKMDKWYTFDDSTVSPVSEDRIVSSNAYVLFYARKDIAYDVDNVFGNNSSVEDEKKSDSEEEIIVSDDDDNKKKNKYGSSSSSSSSTYRHSILSDDDDEFSYSSSLSTYNKPATVFRDYYDDIDSDDDKKKDKDSDDEDSEDEKKKKRFDLSAQSTYVAVPVEKTNESANWTNKVSGHDNIADAVRQMRRPPSSDEDDDDSDYYDAR